MSNWSLPAGVQTETLGNTGAGDGTTITTGSGVKGSYGLIGTTTFAYTGFYLNISSLSGARIRFDVAVDTGGGNQVRIEDLYLDFTGIGIVASTNLFLPLAVPSGASIRVRAQATSGAISTRVMVTGYSTDFPGFQRIRAVRPLNAWGGSAATATDPASLVALTGTTYTAWTEVTAATAEPCCGLLVALGNNAATGRANSRIVCDIGIGAAGSEVLLASVMQGQNANGPGNMVQHIPAMIPTGTRIAFRLATTAALTQATGCVVYGLIP